MAADCWGMDGPSGASFELKRSAFDAAEIPEGSTLSVVPVNCFGTRGDALKG